MQLHEVKSSTDAQRFRDVARRLYRNDAGWVCPLDSDIEAVFDPQINSFFSHGECIRWYATDEGGQLVGRIAAFVDEVKRDAYDIPMGGMGFFECEQDYEKAKVLFDTAKEWLQQRGLKGCFAPINFGENENWWGLLVEGFKDPSYRMNYHLPYYKEFFDKYGFEPEYEQITNLLDLTTPLPERIIKIANWVMKKPNVRLEHLEPSEFERFASDFAEIYNAAWTYKEDFTPMDPAYVNKEFQQMKPIMDKELIWLAYVNDEPAGFIIVIPDVNQIFKHLNGKLHFWNKLRFAWYRSRKAMSRVRVVAMGVVPKYQKLGLESVLTVRAVTAGFEKPHYKEAELSWVGDFNDQMMAVHQGVGATFGKKHITYRLVF